MGQKGDGTYIHTYIHYPQYSRYLQYTETGWKDNGLIQEPRLDQPRIRQAWCLQLSRLVVGDLNSSTAPRQQTQRSPPDPAQNSSVRLLIPNRAPISGVLGNQ